MARSTCQPALDKQLHYHAMAAELAESICAFWQARGDKAEHIKWQKVYQDHLQQAT